MKTLVAEDDFTGRLLLQTILSTYGECHVAVNGKEALQAFQSARDSGHPYDLVCLDIMMPDMDGQESLRRIREIEEAGDARGLNSVKVIMTTALRDKTNVMTAFRNLCDAYLVKPVDKALLLDHLRSLALIK
ncbi:MAG: response regulator [Deltaproteobacteria bacterium]|nr:response regulator [Deltaproteobacteria bacterium]